MLLLPGTYMNESGQAVAPLVRRFGLVWGLVISSVMLMRVVAQILRRDGEKTR